ncbi:uncharacterized protein SEPMUDRAFT_146987 [Sphaerulina musiva SO2202]|uniref:Uncharacterized protein n=1 Tax=Sphaerulina musiva (strain SO2202) TaxID=692275 RepID=M3DA74_SPHMS|nr:uncharacterized protein SEPMUDRAFT_146987 [Sphaerulina musiva SO2202]EMF14985.1 hypothetical protein SEPMUDRAFT_146987 [Sphaerulina musiva SO2202]
MAEQWEQIFKGFGEKTYTISQLIQNANEGDDLSEPLQEIKQTHDALIKDAKELPSDIPDVYDEGAQADLKNAAGDVVIAGNKLIASANDKVEIWKSQKELGKIINKVILTNNDVLDKPYPATNPYAPEIQGQAKKLQTEAIKVMKLIQNAETE